MTVQHHSNEAPRREQQRRRSRLQSSSDPNRTPGPGQQVARKEPFVLANVSIFVNTGYLRKARG